MEDGMNCGEKKENCLKASKANRDWICNNIKYPWEPEFSMQIQLSS